MFSINDKHIIVNYHYVQDFDPQFSGIVPCLIKEFDRQVEFLSKNYRIVLIPEVWRAAEVNSDERVCAITFDDGLRDNYRNALPILKKYSAPATEFIITSIFEGRLPAAHKVQVILSHRPIGELVDFFNDFIKEFYPDLKEHYWIPHNRRITTRRLHESIPVANLKETIIALPEDIRGRFLRHAFKIFKLDEEKIGEHLFMNKKELAEMSAAGIELGSHSHNHYTMTGDNEDALRKDVQLSMDIVKDISGSCPRVFSYPHGRASGVAVRIIKEAGFVNGVGIDRGSLVAGQDPFLLPRYDTMDIRDYLNGHNQ